MVEIKEFKNINTEQKQAILDLWNTEYPNQLQHPDLKALDVYLNNLGDQTHYFAMDSGHTIRGWAFTFQRDNEKWFAMILGSGFQRNGIGSFILNHLKEKETILNGWVIDHNRYFKKNKEVYQSPLKFYLKNNFVVYDSIRLETEKISAVKITWSKLKL